MNAQAESEGSFEELLAEAKNQIAAIYPEWTDWNIHDPGVTILELFAFMTEVAWYRLRYIGTEHRRKYLKLLGVRCQKPRPSRVLLRLESEKKRAIAPCTRFYASGICFENQMSHCLPGGDVAGCLYRDKGQWIFVEQKTLSLTDGRRIPAFGGRPEAGDCFYLLFEKALPTEQPLSLWVQTGRRTHRRNPITPDSGFFPLGTMEVEYRTAAGWQRCKDVSDETWGLLQSGFVRFSLGEQPAKGSLEDKNGYFLRFRLVKASYDLPPEIRQISMNYMEAVQIRRYAVYRDVVLKAGSEASGPEASDSGAGEEREAWYEEDGAVILPLESSRFYRENLAVMEKTGAFYRIYEDYRVRSNRGALELVFSREAGSAVFDAVRVLAWETAFDEWQIPGEGDGLPWQEYGLQAKMPEPESFCLMAEEPGSDGLFAQWQQVEDFSGSGPEDRHYILDIRERKLIFGDGIQGMAPEGKLLIAGYAVTEGSQGNVRAGTVNMVEEGFGDLSVTNPENAFAGSDGEAPEDAFLRARKEVCQNGALVTNEDYENAVRQTPGLLIEACQARRTEVPGDDGEEAGGRVDIVVKPFSTEKNPKLSEAYRRNILVWLEKDRLVGTWISLRSPEYIRLRVYVKCRGRGITDRGKERIRQALHTYFQPFSVCFGGQIRTSGLYACLYRLEEVDEVEALSVEVTGGQAERKSGGDLVLPPGGLVSREDLQYDIFLERG